MRKKEEFIREFNEAFSNNDLDFILNTMSDDIVWNFVGEKVMQGKQEVKEFMKPMSNIQTLDMELLDIISSDKSAAANGRMRIKEPSGETKSFGFVDFYEFGDLEIPTITKMTSYVVPIKEEQN